MKKLLLAFLLSAGPAFAQAPLNLDTVNKTAIIATGNTYQQLQAAATDAARRRSLTIQNNTSASTCYIEITGAVVAGDTTASSKTINGQTMTAAKGSIMLMPGGSYTRYTPYIPKGVIVGTCTTTGDSLYVDIQ